MKRALIVLTACGVFMAPLARSANQAPHWKLTKVSIVGDCDPSGAASGQITVLGATAGYTDKANKKKYPVFVASKSAIKACHISVDFFCTATTKLGWLVGVSGPICTSMVSPSLVSVVKNKVYRFEMTLEGSGLAILVPGLYDICVTVVPNINAPTPVLAGNGGMSTAFARMKLNS